jgi:glycerol uptake facilitator protein
VRRNTMVAELLAEFLGTFTLIVFGVGVVAMVVLGNGLPEPGGDFFSNWLMISFGWGLGVVMAVYVAGGVSGAHINPAVTLGLALRRGFPWMKVVPYWIAQVAGAFVAALLIRWNYWEWFNIVDPGHTYDTQLVFATFPRNISIWGGLRSEIIGTAALVMLVLAIIDTRNTAPLANMGPFVIGLAVVAIGMSLGGLSGYAINPARDFGPRLASYVTGFGTAWRGVQPPHPLYWWVPIVGPLIGGAIGAYVYDLFIGRFVPVAVPEVGREPPPERPGVEEAPSRF